MGAVSIIVGLGLAIAGISGQFGLKGTGSSVALIVIGIAIAGWGVFQLLRSGKY